MITRRLIHGNEKYRPDLIKKFDVVLQNGRYYGTVTEVELQKVSSTDPDHVKYGNKYIITAYNHDYNRYEKIHVFVADIRSEFKNLIPNPPRYSFYRAVEKNRIPVNSVKDFIDICRDMIDEFINKMPNDGVFKRKPTSQEMDDLYLKDGWVFTERGEILFHAYLRRIRTLIMLKFDEEINMEYDITSVKYF